MEKVKDITGILAVMEKAFREFPGTGLRKYRATASTSYCGSTNDYIWSDIPISYITLLTGLEKDALQIINKGDMSGNIFFSKKYGIEVASITVSREYNQYD